MEGTPMLFTIFVLSAGVVPGILELRLPREQRDGRILGYYYAGLLLGWAGMALVR